MIKSHIFSVSRKLMTVGLFFVLTVSVTGARDFAIDENRLEKQSELIAELLVSCRIIIAQNQDLFNNPEKGDKGFTGDVYISKVKEYYKNMTGIEVSESDAASNDSAKKTLGSILVSAKAVIDECQKVLNLKGMGFKHVIPAVIGRRISYKYNKAMGTGYFIKQTSMKYRNPANSPDAFEFAVLKELEKYGRQKGKGAGKVITNSDGLTFYRYLLPVYIEPACLNCHGDPKGEIDITGRIKEGYKLGELRGAISVMIPSGGHK